METVEIIAKKGARSKVPDVLQIVFGALLSVCVIVLLSLFHSLVSGLISPVDILLLLLVLTGKLLISGCKNLRNSHRMPEVMMIYSEGKFTVFQDTVLPEEIKAVKFYRDHKTTGRVVIALSDKKYTLYDVYECRNAARRVAEILADLGVEPFKSAKEAYGKK